VQRVNLAQFQRVHSQGVRQNIHHTFHREGGLQHAKTAESAGRRVIRIDSVAVGLDMGNDIRTSGVRGRAGHHFFAKRGVSAGIAKKFCLRGNEQPVFPRA